MHKQGKFWTCPHGCFSPDPSFRCIHTTGKGLRGDEVVLEIDDSPPETPAAAVGRRARELQEKYAAQDRAWTLADSLRGTPAELAPVHRNLPQYR